jgi:hypothetical protein
MYCRFLALLLVTTATSAPPDSQHLLVMEPTYQSGAPKYCLLTFGPAAETGVWLVHDGDALYVDRNGNGDLTDPNDRVAADERQSTPADGQFAFVVGDLRDGDLTHKDLRVAVMRLDHLADRYESIRKVLESTPDARFYMVSMDIDMPGRHGAGIGGRVPQTAAGDASGFLRFADAAGDAPLINFGGPWQITLSEPLPLTIGRQVDAYLAVGTPGIGAGTTAFVGYEELIPPGLAPRIEVTFPPTSPDAAPYKELFELRHRC